MLSYRKIMKGLEWDEEGIGQRWVSEKSILAMLLDLKPWFSNKIVYNNDQVAYYKWNSQDTISPLPAVVMQ